MQENIDRVELPETANSRLPLGYKQIQRHKIPSAQVEQRLILYNKKYKFFTKMVNVSTKPISKILK
ncbi:MAG: hypothetical protein ABIQ31_08495 [Ferruginibacter sp.]